jgi:hypothetical protein
VMAIADVAAGQRYFPNELIVRFKHKYVKIKE